MIGTRDRFNAFLDLAEVPVPHAKFGPLAGTRLAVKDIYDVAGYRTGCGNPQKLYEAEFAEQTAPAVRAILDAGARFAGKTQTDELAFSLMGQNAHFPPPVNPAAPDRVTGGSSSGSAAAVAGGLAHIGIGSDTGGSIRAPASFCGLIGLRTTHGRVSLAGVMPLAPSFDTFGWFADDIETYEATGKVVLGRDANKGTLARPIGFAPLDALVAGRHEALEYKRIRRFVTGDPAEADWPFASTIDELYWSFRQLQAQEAWAAHGAWISAKDRDLGPGIEARFGFGATIDAKKVKAEKVRRFTFRAELKELLGSDGYLVLPTVPGAAPLISTTQDELQAYREQALRLLCLSGLSGFPQITLPLGKADGAPFGISLLGPPDSDIALIRLARAILERARAAKG